MEHQYKIPLLRARFLGACRVDTSNTRHQNAYLGRSWAAYFLNSDVAPRSKLSNEGRKGDAGYCETALLACSYQGYRQARLICSLPPKTDRHVQKSNQ